MGDVIGSPIVVGVDESETSRRALQAALDIAQTLGSELIVVSAYRRLPDGRLKADQRNAPADIAWRLQGDSAVQGVLDDAREQAEAAGVSVACVAREGAPAAVIVAVAAERGAGLVVVGNRGMRGRGRVRGSVPNDVSHSAPCSVLIVDTADSPVAV